MARRTTDSDITAQNQAAAAGDGAGGGAAAGKDPLAAELGRRGGLKGGKARAAKLSPERRRAIAQQAAAKRWARRRAGEAAGETPSRLSTLAVVDRRGILQIGAQRLEVYVLDDGRRVLGLMSLTAALAGSAQAELQRELEAAGQDLDLGRLVISFTIPGDWRVGRGMESSDVVTLCRLVSAPGRARSSAERQALAARALALLDAWAQVGLRSMLDSAVAEVDTAAPP